VSEHYDLLVVGGGINGAGIARDAAGRGLSVLLVEQRDLASATSSSSTKLIHGGLRYLEHYEFRLVREALQEREVLLAAAPHIIWPLTFVLPHHKGLRPKWMLRAGLFLYDHLAKRKRLPGSRALSLNGTKEGKPLLDQFTSGFSYSDCWVDDARLVVLNALDARNGRLDRDIAIRRRQGNQRFGARPGQCRRPLGDRYGQPCRAWRQGRGVTPCQRQPFCRAAHSSA
jgi:glycerol-3-phosphate dehydrogenase